MTESEYTLRRRIREWYSVNYLLNIILGGLGIFFGSIGSIGALDPANGWGESGKLMINTVLLASLALFGTGLHQYYLHRKTTYLGEWKSIDEM